MKENRHAFTLTEVLLAVVIVGIIAALVLPAIINHYQKKGFSQAYDRDVQTIQNAVDGLAITENKATFFETMMYTDEEPESYKDTSEKFLKKYMRVSKLCGDNNGDCFAKTYYEFKDNDKVVYNPTYKGSCAILKNGASICITPQIAGNGPTGLIDLNGIKGPNVLGTDLQPFVLEPKYKTSLSQNTGEIKDTQFLVDLNDPEPDPEPPLPPEPPTPDPEPDPDPPKKPCKAGDYSLECCLARNPHTYKGANSACCKYDEIQKGYSEYCKQTIKVSLDCVSNGPKRGDFDCGGDFYNGGRDCVSELFRCKLTRSGTTDHFSLEISYANVGYARAKGGTVYTKGGVEDIILYYNSYEPIYVQYKLTNLSNNHVNVDIMQENMVQEIERQHDLTYTYFGSNF
ncbi:MAG: type II secretion system protein [Candidatus Gastranaerophilaceae bacterium]